MTAEQVFDEYYRGVYTAPESVLRLLTIIDADNVESIMSQAPEQFLPHFERWIAATDDQTAVFIAPGRPPDVSREMEDLAMRGVPFVEEWLDRRRHA